MQQTKFDYNALKLEYFESEIDEIKSFWLEKGLKYNSRVSKYTSGRGEEKKKWKEGILAKALAKKQNELAKKVEISVDELLQAKRDIVDLLKVKLEEYFNDLDENGKSKINVKDLKTLREMTKTELGEPTTIAKNDNDNKFVADGPLVQIVRADISNKQ